MYEFWGMKENSFTKERDRKTRGFTARYRRWAWFRK